MIPNPKKIDHRPKDLNLPYQYSAGYFSEPKDIDPFSLLGIFLMILAFLPCFYICSCLFAKS